MDKLFIHVFLRPEYEDVLVAKIGASTKWAWDFPGWYEEGHLFDDGSFDGIEFNGKSSYGLNMVSVCITRCVD